MINYFKELLETLKDIRRETTEVKNQMHIMNTHLADFRKVIRTAPHGSARQGVTVIDFRL